MVVSVLRPRIERLLYGDEFVSDDLSRLFLYLRETSYGRQTVREVGDFVAHFGMRDKGPTTQLATNFFTVLRFFTPLLADPEHLHGLSVNPDVLYRVPEIVTLGRLPGEGESDSRWRTKEVRHVGSDTLTPGF